MDRKRRQYDDDDGRVIAPMNVEGMPGYAPKPREENSGGEKEPLSKQELKWYMSGALKAALLIGLVFSAGIVLFIVFLLLIWK